MHYPRTTGTSTADTETVKHNNCKQQTIMIEGGAQ